jgi:hypothetical protein
MTDVQITFHYQTVTNTKAKITREIRQASSPTMRGHFGYIFKAIRQYTTREAKAKEKADLNHNGVW